MRLLGRMTMIRWEELQCTNCGTRILRDQEVGLWMEKATDRIYRLCMICHGRHIGEILERINQREREEERHERA